MNIAHSKVTVQGQISVPAKVRERLAIGPGSVIEWEEEGDRIVVRRAGKYSSSEIHDALFSDPPAPKSESEIRAGIVRHIAAKYAGR